MRLVTWNCYRGECRSRAALLSQLDADLVVLQECGVPTAPPDSKCLWFGNRAIQGVGIVSPKEFELAAGSVQPQAVSMYPVRVRGSCEFHLLAVWAQPNPTYVRSIVDELGMYREFAKEAPCVIVGDFNSHPVWDHRDRQSNHSSLDRFLLEEFGLVSAFHAHAKRQGIETEPPTLYWRWQQDQPYHIDYCYVPLAWAERIAQVEIGTFDTGSSESDHRPLVVEIANDTASTFLAPNP